MGKGQGAALTLIIGVVTAIIGFAIVSAVAANTTNLSSAANESHTLSGVPELVTLNHGDISSLAVTNATDEYTLVDADYDIIDAEAGTVNITTSYDNTAYGNEVMFSYNYEGETYFGSSLARTIITYVVPIGLLGVLALAAGLGGMFS